MSLRRRFGWSIVNNASTLAISATSLLLISRKVDPSQYGQAAVVIAVWGILMSPITWCGQLIVRFGAIEHHDTGKIARAITARVFIGIVPLAAALLAAPLWTWRVSSVPRFTIVLTSAYVVAALGFDVFRSISIALHRLAALALANVVLKGTPIVAIVVWSLATRTVTARVLLVAVAVGTFGAALVLMTVNRRDVAPASLDRTLVRDMWRYGRGGLVGMPALALIAAFDPLVLGRYASSAEVGRYQLVYPVFTVCTAIGTTFLAVIFPELVRARARGDQHAWDTYRDAQPRISILAAGCVMALALLFKPIVSAVLSARYAESAEIGALLTVAGGFLVALIPLEPLVTAGDNTLPLHLGYVMQALLNVAIDLLLVRRYGAVGVALANVVAWATGFITVSLLARRTTGTRVTAIVVLPPIAAATAAAILFLPTVVNAIVAVAALALLAPRLLRLIGTWRPKESDESGAAF